MTGRIPPELGGLSKLRILNLHQNGLTGEVPSMLADLAALETLSLYENDLTGCVPAGLRDQLERLVADLEYCGN